MKERRGGIGTSSTEDLASVMKEGREGIGTSSPVVFSQLYEGKKWWNRYIIPCRI
jgi:hypothetical protein